MDRFVRRFVPSLARLSYNPIFKVVGNAVSAVPALLYPEFRNLPPNHMRVRIGTGSNVIFNQPFYLRIGTNFWLPWLASGYVTAKSDIVEIGCGCGRIAHYLRGDWFSGTYVGVDIDQEMLDWDASHFPRDKFSFIASPHTSATYVAGDGQRRSDLFSFPQDWKKDFVYSTSLYTHLLEPELRNYTSESFKVLRPGGTMYMSFFCLDSVGRDGRWTFQHRIGDAYVENMKYPEAAVAYTRQFMGDQCRSTGFSEVSINETPTQSTVTCRK